MTENDEQRILMGMLLEKALVTENLKIEQWGSLHEEETRLVLKARMGPGFPYFTISTLPLHTPTGPTANALRVA